MDIGDAKLIIKAEDQTKEAFNQINTATNNMSQNFKKAGLAITAIGVAMAATLTKMVTSYAEAGDQVAKSINMNDLKLENMRGKTTWFWNFELQVILNPGAKGVRGKTGRKPGCCRGKDITAVKGLADFRPEVVPVGQVKYLKVRLFLIQIR